jgi:hypothetical protein
LRLVLGVAALGDHYLDVAHDYSFGRLGEPAKVSITVEIDVTEGMRFTPLALPLRKAKPSALCSRTPG